MWLLTLLWMLETQAIVSWCGLQWHRTIVVCLCKCRCTSGYFTWYIIRDYYQELLLEFKFKKGMAERYLSISTCRCTTETFAFPSDKCGPKLLTTVQLQRPGSWRYTSPAARPPAEGAVNHPASMSLIWKHPMASMSLEVAQKTEHINWSVEVDMIMYGFPQA